MSMECGMSLYFKANRIRFRNQLIMDLGSPDFVHLFIDTKKRFVYVQACQEDRDAFKLYYIKGPGDQNFYIRAKKLLTFLAKMIDVEADSFSYRFSGDIVDSKTARISLNDYEVIQNN